MLNTIIDKVQATFPPNRVVILLAGLITAVSSTASAWLAAHFPGLNLGTVEIAGVLGAAALITIRLLDRWIDQWQHHENINVQADLEGQLDGFVDSPEAQAFFVALGTFHGLGEALATLRSKVETGDLSYEELAQELGHFGQVISEFIADHPVEIPPPAVAVASPPAEAVPPAAPQPAE